MNPGEQLVPEDPEPRRILERDLSVAVLATNGWGQLTASLLGGIGLSSLVFVFIRGQQPRARRLRLRAAQSN